VYARKAEKSTGISRIKCGIRNGEWRRRKRREYFVDKEEGRLIGKSHPQRMNVRREQGERKGEFKWTCA
jgi:hypothetical protein